MEAISTEYLLGDPDEPSFRNFDRGSFRFHHRLHETGLFSFAAILDLAERVSRKPNRWYLEEGEATPESGWSARNRGESLPEALRTITENRGLVMLKRVHEEREYKALLDLVEDELASLTGFDFSSRYRDGLMTILVAAPGRVTPYHIDGEANLLMQMSGRKSVYIFDGGDREILPETELERFWAGDITAAKYRAHLQERAACYDLVPGGGVSNPVTFPHWVQNGEEVSISLSVNFKRCLDDQADAYRINRQLRRIGLRPTEPGKAIAVDRTKGMVYRAARQVKRRLTSQSS